MKIISLNIWGGRAGESKLLEFFAKHKDADVFCLQEVWSAPYKEFDGHAAGGVAIDHRHIMTEGMQKISSMLSNHAKYFRPHFMDNYGLLLLIKKDFDVIAEGEIFVYKEKGHIPDGDIGNHARNIQYVTLVTNGQSVTIVNFHGLWNGKGKTDTDDRINQSQNIGNFIESLNGECVLCGDFNLLPDTKSIQMLEKYGLRNLINEYNIPSTRTSYYTKPEKHADYVFVSGGIKVTDFQVLPEEVSDHAPLLVEIH